MKSPIFHFLSRQKLETIDDLLSISLLIGSIVDRLEINSTDLVVSYHFVSKEKFLVGTSRKFFPEQIEEYRFSTL